MSGLMSLDAHWLWIIGGLVLIGIETVASGLFLLWIGLAALVAGLIAWLIPLSLTAELILFALLGLVAIQLGRTIQKRQLSETTDTPFLNERGKALIGRRLVLETAITNGVGTVRLDDSIWRVTGQDMPAGSAVIVRAVDGSTLLVDAGQA